MTLIGFIHSSVGCIGLLFQKKKKEKRKKREEKVGSMTTLSWKIMCAFKKYLPIGISVVSVPIDVLGNSIFLSPDSFIHRQYIEVINNVLASYIGHWNDGQEKTSMRLCHRKCNVHNKKSVLFRFQLSSSYIFCAARGLPTPLIFPTEISLVLVYLQIPT